jgi:hypothetical protein
MINLIKLKLGRDLFFAFLFGIFLSALILFPAKTLGKATILTAPTISVAPDVYYPFDEILYLEGHATPKSKVSLYFEKPGSQPVRLLVEANSNGEWYFAQKLELASGEWMLRARNELDLPSDWSNPRIIQSIISGFAIGPLKIKYLPVVFGFSAFFLIGLCLFLYSVFRIRTIKKMEYEQKIHQEKQDLEKKLREKDKEIVSALVEGEFAELRRNLMEELLHFDQKMRLGGGLSQEENEHRARLLKELNEIEVAIEKKLKNMA